MKRLVAILFLIPASCQKELSCDGMPGRECPDKQVICISGRVWTLPAHNIDPYEHPAFTPSNNAYLIMVHPDFMATVKDCLPINLPDSAGYYKVVNKDVHRYTTPDGIFCETPYVQIGGHQSGGWGQNGDPENFKTYFFNMQFDEWNTITTIFKPKLD